MSTQKINTVLLILILVVGSVALLKHHGHEDDESHAHMWHADSEEYESAHDMMHSDTEMSESISKVPTMPGQEAFGTIQEIITILDNDPDTDWSKVDIDALQQHLIDMDELTMHTDVQREDVPGGLKMTVTGSGRTIDAIKRMVPTHNAMTLSSVAAWNTTVQEIANGEVLTVTSDDSAETDKIRALGFIGIMAIGSEHPAHHLMMAKGIMHTPSNQ